MTKKKIILTFDYEMYLGQDSGTIEKCMIEPTNKILQIFKEYEVKGLFFVDATFLSVVKKDFYSGYLKIKGQILDILRSGSDIGLHIHPHWIDSYMIGKNKWSFKSYEKFRIHNLSKKQISKVLKDSFVELDCICKEYSKDYKIDSFRAGGWCIQPFESLKDDLKALSIINDFSVLPGMKKENLPKHYYNYEKVPQKNFWKFEDDVLIENENGTFIEVPTSVVKMNIFDVIKLKKKIKVEKRIGDGKGADNSSRGIINKFKKLKPFIKYTLSSDYMSLDMFQKNINSIENDFLVYVSHPKNFSDESFEILEYICQNYMVCSIEGIK